MNDEAINRLRELARQATPGPWRVAPRWHGEQKVASVNVLEIVPPISVELAHWTIDADYIAAASPDAVLALLQEVERLRAENAGVVRGGTPLYTHPQPPSTQADAIEALRMALDALSCTGDPDDPGHRCGHCDEYVDRNSVVRKLIRAVPAAQGGADA